jgi:hypothetical protein
LLFSSSLNDESEISWIFSDMFKSWESSNGINFSFFCGFFFLGDDNFMKFSFFDFDEVLFLFFGFDFDFNFFLFNNFLVEVNIELFLFLSGSLFFCFNFDFDFISTIS